MFAFFHKKRKVSYIADVEDYCEKILATEKLKEKNAIKYSIRINPSDKVRYSDRYYPSRTNDAVRMAISGSGDSIPLYMDQSFSSQVIELIRTKGLTETTIYKGALLDRRLFSKLLTDHNYTPSKDTAVSVALSLQLSLEEAQDLLNRAGYSLSHSIKRDVVLEYFFVNHIYSVSDINIVLDKLGLKSLGR